jgi:LemA protein
MLRYTRTMAIAHEGGWFSRLVRGVAAPFFGRGRPTPRAGWLGLALVLALGVSGCGYNEVIERDEGVKASWAEVENQYQRRADLVPNLVRVVKGAADFEKGTLEAVVEARSKVGSIQVDSSTIDDPQKLKQFEQAQGQLTSALSRLLVVSENYPQLKATDAFKDLQSQLEGTENRIAVARRRFIQSVAEYNATVLKFPSSIGAKMRGKAERATFTATTPGADKAPEVAF